MSHHRQEELKAKLVMEGFWDATAQYDPTRNWIALEELTARLQNMLAEAACLFVYLHDGGSQSYKVILSYKQDQDVIIGFGKDIYEAICTAALTLPTLFAEHPEYAAQSCFNSSIELASST